MEYIEFYLPSCKTLLEDESAVLVWLELMDMYCTDLKWLLAAPHHQFWSVMIYSPGVPQTVLQTFLLGAPQWFDKQFQVYLEHETICPKYQEIYSLVFRVFMRLCTFKESKVSRHTCHLKAVVFIYHSNNWRIWELLNSNTPL